MSNFRNINLSILSALFMVSSAFAEIQMSPIHINTFTSAYSESDMSMINPFGLSSIRTITSNGAQNFGYYRTAVTGSVMYDYESERDIIFTNAPLIYDENGQGYRVTLKETYPGSNLFDVYSYGTAYGNKVGYITNNVIHFNHITYLQNRDATHYYAWAEFSKQSNGLYKLNAIGQEESNENVIGTGRLISENRQSNMAGISYELTDHLITDRSGTYKIEMNVEVIGPEGFTKSSFIPSLKYYKDGHDRFLTIGHHIISDFENYGIKKSIFHQNLLLMNCSVQSL
jgi:hypothetical protein